MFTSASGKCFIYTLSADMQSLRLEVCPSQAFSSCLWRQGVPVPVPASCIRQTMLETAVGMVWTHSASPQWLSDTSCKLSSGSMSLPSTGSVRGASTWHWDQVTPLIIVTTPEEMLSLNSCFPCSGSMAWRWTKHTSERMSFRAAEPQNISAVFCSSCKARERDCSQNTSSILALLYSIPKQLLWAHANTSQKAACNPTGRQQ